ncbi:hypothetical protein RvY_01060 [Ramazzottius varieornatus]|uniref:Receptor ligand binding region domain-containing protein n=1 Tax=Ramazzottius varieornatus TaxID=947166 RepID=A0A1D1UEY5_RAMVA|nr:hypothetical protein RvY_01060 [Ramazzottius varieornatus]
MPIVREEKMVRLRILPCFFITGFTSMVRFAVSDPIKIRAGVILTENSTLAYDMRNVRPALEVGYATALADHNVQYETIWISYDHVCRQWNALGYATILALVDKVDVIIGPGCSDDLIIVSELTSFFAVPMLSGAGKHIETHKESNVIWQRNSYYVDTKYFLQGN